MKKIYLAAQLAFCIFFTAFAAFQSIRNIIFGIDAFAGLMFILLTILGNYLVGSSWRELHSAWKE